MTDKNFDRMRGGEGEEQTDFAKYMYGLPEGDPISITAASALLAGKITVDEAIMLDSSQSTFPDITDI